MAETESAPASSPETTDLGRALRRFLLAEAIQDPPPLRHEGACGPRGYCPRPDCADRASQQTLELLPNGTLYAYCHREVLRPGDPGHAELTEPIDR
jgi:hypothetical protein